MRLELKVSVEFSATDAAMLADYLNENNQTETEFVSGIVECKARQVIAARKREVGQILALKGEVDEQLRIESVKMAEARKSPW